MKSKETKKNKPPIKAEKISLDDFTTEVDGQEYHPHEGEYVEVIPIRQLSSLKNLMRLAQFNAEEFNLGDPKILDQYDGLTKYLSDVIFDWNLTDDGGDNLPRPFKNPEIIEKLSLEEINYLVAKLIGGRTDDSKNS